MPLPSLSTLAVGPQQVTSARVWVRWAPLSQLADLPLLNTKSAPVNSNGLCFPSLFFTCHLLPVGGQPSPPHKLSPLLEFTGGFVLHFSLCAAHLKMPIFSQPLYTHTILLPANGAGNQLVNPSPWCLALQVSLIAKGNRSVGASIRSSLRHQLQEGFSSICICAVLHTGETDRSVMCNISVFLISSMNYPPSPHDFISFLGRLVLHLLLSVLP